MFFFNFALGVNGCETTRKGLTNNEDLEIELFNFYCFQNVNFLWFDPSLERKSSKGLIPRSRSKLPISFFLKGKACCISSEGEWEGPVEKSYKKLKGSLS